MNWKITPSLYNAWLFYIQPLLDRDEEQEKAARDEFLRVLRKESAPETPEQARGHVFENTIEYLATGKCEPTHGILTGDDTTSAEYACARLIADRCRDGVFQERGGRELPSGDYIYGVADCILPTNIVDFKRCGVGKYEMAKYQKSIQHLAYMYIWDMRRFDYLICDGSSEEPFDEFYLWNAASLGLLESRVALMINSITQDPEMREIFAQYWSYVPVEKKYDARG